MGFLRRFATSPISMDKVNAAYKQLYPLKVKYIEAANSRDENEEQAASLILSTTYKEVRKAMKLSGEEQKKLIQMLNDITINPSKHATKDSR